MSGVQGLRAISVAGCAWRGGPPSASKSCGRIFREHGCAISTDSRGMIPNVTGGLPGRARYRSLAPEAVVAASCQCPFTAEPRPVAALCAFS